MILKGGKGGGKCTKHVLDSILLAQVEQSWIGKKRNDGGMKDIKI
jgi:hypothetical protein